MELTVGAILEGKTKVFISKESVDSDVVLNFSENPPEAIKEMIYKCLANNFKSIFIDHEDY